MGKSITSHCTHHLSVLSIYIHEADVLQYCFYFFQMQKIHYSSPLKMWIMYQPFWTTVYTYTFISNGGKYWHWWKTTKYNCNKTFPIKELGALLHGEPCAICKHSAHHSYTQLLPLQNGWGKHLDHGLFSLPLCPAYTDAASVHLESHYPPLQHTISVNTHNILKIPDILVVN